jgi:hypothetical protein
MRKTGLTSATLQHLDRLSERVSARRVGVWEEEAEGASIQQGLDVDTEDAITSDSSDDNEFMMGEEQTDIVTSDSKKDYATGIAEDVNRKEDPVLVDMKPEPWTDAWELTARNRTIAYDIENFEKEDASGESLYGDVGIEISISVAESNPTPEDQRKKLSEHIQRVVSESLEVSRGSVFVSMHSEAPSMPTPDSEGGVDVMVSFSGIDPDERDTLTNVVEGLVLEAVMSYGGF